MRQNYCRKKAQNPQKLLCSLRFIAANLFL